MTRDALEVVVVALLGLVMGSAVTAIAWRVPRGRSWIRGRSACPSCGTTLGVLDLIPVLSWVLARGKCRHCGAPVSWRYPLTEVLCVSWALLLHRQVGLTPALPLLGLWGGLLIALLWIDLDFQLLPDVLTFPGTLIGLAAALSLQDGARHALFGLVMGSGLLALVAWAYFRIRRVDGMGGGDIKLAAMFGVVLGWQLTLLTIMLAAFAGTLWGGLLMARGQGGPRTALPFGTLLAPAALVAFLWGPAILHGYARLFR